jgi:hypothetical protein
MVKEKIKGDIQRDRRIHRQQDDLISFVLYLKIRKAD